MEKMVVLKAKKERVVCPAPRIMPFLFVLKTKIIKYTGQSSNNFRQRIQGKKTKIKKKKSLNLRKKLFRNIVLFHGSCSPSALCLVFICTEGFVVRPHSSATCLLQEALSCGTERLGRSWAMRTTRPAVIPTSSGKSICILISLG